MDSLFKGSVRKSRYKTVDHDLTELPTKLKLVIFHELTDLHYLSNQKRASYFFENLDNFINWLYDTDHGLKNLIEENWVHKNLKSGQQKMEFKTKFLAIKIYKNGNCELTFSKGFLKDLNIIKNHIDNGGEIKDAQKITLFEQVISDFGLKKCRPFELGNGSKVFKFMVKRKEALLLASSKRLYVSCAGFKFKCDYDNGSFHRLVENLRKCLIDSEAVKVDRQVKYLPEESAIKVSEIGRFIDLKTILEKEYKCDLSLEPGCLNGQITIKNRKYALSVDKILQIFSEGFEQRIDIIGKTNKQIFGYLKVVFASCQLILDECPAETKRVAPKYHNEENEAQIIPLKNSTKIENPNNSVSIIHSSEEGTYIQGDTKPVKDHLKRFGFSWSWETMFWYVRGSRNRAFCDESKKRCDDLSSFLMEKGYHVRQHYPQDAINLVN